MGGWVGSRFFINVFGLNLLTPEADKLEFGSGRGTTGRHLTRGGDFIQNLGKLGKKYIKILLTRACTKRFLLEICSGNPTPVRPYYSKKSNFSPTKILNCPTRS